MKVSENIRVGLDILPFNPKNKRKSPEVEDFADEYTITIRRSDGQGMSKEEALALMFHYCIHSRRLGK